MSNGYNESGCHEDVAIDNLESLEEIRYQTYREEIGNRFFWVEIFRDFREEKGNDDGLKLVLKDLCLTWENYLCAFTSLGAKLEA